MQHARHMPPRRGESEAAARPVNHTDPTALQILADWIAELTRSPREPLVDRDFVVLG